MNVELMRTALAGLGMTALLGLAASSATAGVATVSVQVIETPDQYEVIVDNVANDPDIFVWGFAIGSAIFDFPDTTRPNWVSTFLVLNEGGELRGLGFGDSVPVVETPSMVDPVNLGDIPEIMSLFDDTFVSANFFWNDSGFSDPGIDIGLAGAVDSDDRFFHAALDSPFVLLTTNGSAITGTTTHSTNDIPEPATLLVFGGGLLGFGALRRRRRRLA